MVVLNSSQIRLNKFIDSRTFSLLSLNREPTKLLAQGVMKLLTTWQAQLIHVER